MKQRGFTLIELLIVVAIIAILAAIAVPNFLEAQVRAKVSRVKSDQRSIATALESYRVDYTNYPNPNFPGLYPDTGRHHYIQYIPALTTPVSYITSVDLRDPFTINRDSLPFTVDPDFIGSYWYGCYGTGIGLHNWGTYAFFPGFMLVSWGPDRFWTGLEHYPMDVHAPGGCAHLQDWMGVSHRLDLVYDPTNGTRSSGDIGRTGSMAGVPEVLGG